MWSFGVPNVPCGVERLPSILFDFLQHSFLMYRVELKVSHDFNITQNTRKFLMYRVELKEKLACLVFCCLEMFLMYRVELKVRIASLVASWRYFPVPNVPCGVESPLSRSNLISSQRFLMYRVELKESSLSVFMLLVRVPNVPCGVESEIPLKGII